MIVINNKVNNKEEMEKYFNAVATDKSITEYIDAKYRRNRRYKSKKNK